MLVWLTLDVLGGFVVFFLLGVVVLLLILVVMVAVVVEVVVVGHLHPYVTAKSGQWLVWKFLPGLHESPKTTVQYAVYIELFLKAPIASPFSSAQSINSLEMSGQKAVNVVLFHCSVSVLNRTIYIFNMIIILCE